MIHINPLRPSSPRNHAREFKAQRAAITPSCGLTSLAHLSEKYLRVAGISIESLRRSRQDMQTSGRKFFVGGNIKCVRDELPVKPFLTQSQNGSREFLANLVKGFNEATIPAADTVGTYLERIIHPLFSRYSLNRDRNCSSICLSRSSGDQRAQGVRSLSSKLLSQGRSLYWRDQCRAIEGSRCPVGNPWSL